MLRLPPSSLACFSGEIRLFPCCNHTACYMLTSHWQHAVPLGICASRFLRCAGCLTGVYSLHARSTSCTVGKWLQPAAADDDGCCWRLVPSLVVIYAHRIAYYTISYWILRIMLIFFCYVLIHCLHFLIVKKYHYLLKGTSRRYSLQTCLCRFPF